MTHLITTGNQLEAWTKGATFVMDNGPTLNLVLEVQSPGVRGGTPKTLALVDDLLRTIDEPTTHAVAETIFPADLYRRYGLDGVLKVYPEEVYPAIRPHRKIGWGTYAYRIVRRELPDGQAISPLGTLIDTMRQESFQGGSKRSCYEITLSDPRFDIAIYDPSCDRKRRMGGPCLSHLSFKLFNNAVYLTALYRSHDYCRKVLGNLLGLARLQGCVAKETNQQIGSLVVHSSYAYATHHKRMLRECIQNIESQLGGKP